MDIEKLVKCYVYKFLTDPGCTIYQFFDGVDVGDNHVIAGKMDSVVYNLWEMKEPDYVMRMMVSSGQLSENETCKEAEFRFRYACPFNSHADDDHKNLCHGLLLVEDSSTTQ